MRETTGRSVARRAEGTLLGAPALAPRTLVFSGATGTVCTTVAVFHSAAGTFTAALLTDSEFVIARVGTAVTAPATF